MKKIQLENKEYIIDITKETYSKLDKKGRREYKKQGNYPLRGSKSNLDNTNLIKSGW